MSLAWALVIMGAATFAIGEAIWLSAAGKQGKRALDLMALATRIGELTKVILASASVCFLVDLGLALR